MSNRTMCAALVLLTLGACTRQRAEWAGSIVRAEGVLRVTNPTVPLAGSGEVTRVLLWSQAGPETGPVWEVPNRLHVFRGRVFLPDRRASRVHRVTADGILLPSFGEPGSGPGQYRRIIDAIPTAAGLFVVDGGNGRVELLSDAGVIAATINLDRVVFSAAALGPDAIVIFGVLGGQEGWARLDAAGVGEPVDFPDFEMPANVSGSVSSGSTWGEMLVRLKNTSPEVRVYSRAGTLERVIDIPKPVQLATDEEIERIVLDMSTVLARDAVPAGEIQQQADRIRARPREKRRFRKVVFDDDAGLAAIWEQNPEDLGSGNATLHLLTLGGVYLAELGFDRAWADFDLEGGVLFCLSRDPATDLVTLQAHRLSVPEPVLERARSITAGRGAGQP